MSYQMPVPLGKGLGLHQASPGPRAPQDSPRLPSPAGSMQGTRELLLTLYRVLFRVDSFRFELPDLTGCSHPRKCGPRVPPVREQEAPCLGARASSTCSAREDMQAAAQVNAHVLLGLQAELRCFLNYLGLLAQHPPPAL